MFTRALKTEKSQLTRLFNLPPRAKKLDVLKLSLETFQNLTSSVRDVISLWKVTSILYWTGAREANKIFEANFSIRRGDNRFCNMRRRNGLFLLLGGSKLSLLKATFHLQPPPSLHYSVCDSILRKFKIFTNCKLPLPGSFSGPATTYGKYFMR